MRWRTKHKPMCVVITVLSLFLAIGIFSLGAQEKSEPASAKEDLELQKLEKVKVLLKEGNFADAETLAHEILAEVEAEHGATSLQAAQVIDILTESIMGRREQDLNEHNASIKQTKSEKERSDLHESWTSRDEKRTEEALMFSERSLKIKEQLLGSKDQSLAVPLTNIGKILRKTGQLTESKPFLKRALVLIENAPNYDSQAVIDALKELLIVAYQTNDNEEWFLLYERSLSIWEKTLGSDHPDIATHLVNIGRQHLNIGNYSEAGPYLIRATAIAEKFYGPKSEEFVWYVYNLALLHRLSGDYERSIIQYKRTFAILGEIYGLESTKLDRYLWSLAGMFTEMKDFAQAEEYVQRVMKKWDTYYGPGTLESVPPLELYSGILRHKGNIDEALVFIQRAVKILEENDSPDTRMVNPLRKLAGLYCDKGEGKKGLEFIERALAIREKSHGPDNITMTWVLNDYVENLWSNGLISDAIKNAYLSEEIARNHLRQYFTSASGRQALSYDTTKARSLDMILSTSVQTQDEIKGVGGEAWDAFIRSRALVLDEMMMRNRIVSEAANPEVYAMFHTLTSARRQLSDLVVSGPGSMAPGENYSELMAQARNEKEQAEQALAEASIIFRDEIARKRAGFDEIKTSLTPGSALVSFARYIHYDLPPKDLEDKSVPFRDLSQGQSYLAFILRAQEEEPKIVPLGKAEEIEPLIFDWGQEAARGIRIPGRSAKEAVSVYRAAGENLRRKIWDPIATHLGETRQVFIVPDGSLHTVNFSALPIELEKYLIEDGPLIHYLSAERDLISSGKPPVSGEGLLAMGDPAFDETMFFSILSSADKPKQSFFSKVSDLLPFRGTHSICGDFKSLKFYPLPEAKKEINEIVDIWKRSQDYRGEDIKLLGGDADEASFKMVAPGKQILHLATHGFFLEGNCQPAVEHQDKQLESEQEKTEVLPLTTRENPLLLSGLALAGANHRESSRQEEEDGILTAEEVAALDLSGVDWVILSACDTGVGIIRAGEGVLGLRRAFQIAGAQTLITSLWAVDDESTRRWMRTLYEKRFLKEQNTAESVHDASLEVLQERRRKNESTHPFYWAGFVASGDWR
jgi:CHAT domain-containing protein/tetratricopeptide (TPR) repeat protein